MLLLSIRKLAVALAYVIFKFLVEPDPDALLVELVLAGSGHDKFGCLLQGLLTDAAVRLVRELKPLHGELERFHKFAEFYHFGDSPLHDG